MAAFLAKDIRNIALIGHSGEGKTSLAEAILYNAKAIDRQGRTDDGNTTMDFDPEEIAKKISISLALANCVYNGVKINLIDVPGYFDFEGELVEALSVADCAIIVTQASGSLSVGTEKAMDYCIAHKVPAVIFISGLDKENCNYVATVEAISAKYSTKVAPMFLPDMQNGFCGYVDIVSGKYHKVGEHGKNGGDVPQHLADSVSDVRAKVVEAAAETDDELMMKFFEGEELSEEEIASAIKNGIASCTTVPILGGAAVANKGIFNLMNFIVSTIPSSAAHLLGSESDQVVLKIFKTIVDPFVGRLSLFRVLSGTLKSGMILKNINKEDNEKTSSIYFLKGKKQEPCDTAYTGDLGALAKLVITTTGDVLCEKQAVEVEPITMPRPVLSMAVYAAKKGEEDKIFAGLSKLKDEDISFTVTKDPETNEMLLSGVGETQLDVLCRKLKNKFGVEAVLKEPRIAFRETIKKSIEAEGKHKKQTGGAGQYGHCKVRFEPGAADGTFEFVDAVVGGTVPRQFIPAVEKGLRQAILHGVLAGYPMVNLKATLFDGSSHPVDSKEIAYVSAAKLAYAHLTEAAPTVLEPVYELRIVVPDNFLGDIMGDMSKRNGRIMGTEGINGKQIVTAEAPMSKITKYATDLRSMTQGRGSFSLQFSRYEEVPQSDIPKIIEDAKKFNAEEE